MRRLVQTVIATGAFLALLSSNIAQASFFSYPRALKFTFAHLRADEPALPPFAHTRFCLVYPQDCKVRGIVFRGGGFKLTPQRMLDLLEVNAKINRAITPEPNLGGLPAERWVLYPKSGDCNDYAVTKRHELIKRGWPSRALLLAEVVTTWGEHHLVVVVHTREGDFVADSLTPQIRRWAAAPYRWVRVQSPQNPVFWEKPAGSAA